VLDTMKQATPSNHETSNNGTEDPRRETTAQTDHSATAFPQIVFMESV
jgi:hypothetical protein